MPLGWARRTQGALVETLTLASVPRLGSTGTGGQALWLLPSKRYTQSSHLERGARQPLAIGLRAGGCGKFSARGLVAPSLTRHLKSGVLASELNYIAQVG